MSDAALLTRPKTDRAFERLYTRHVHDVYRYVLAVLRNPADAEDVTQATFLNAYRAFRRGDRPELPRNWLLRIAHNECRQRFRMLSRRPKEVVWDERVAAPPVDETVPTADEIRQALGHLSFNQRSALVMRELEGRSYGEIGEILDLGLRGRDPDLPRTASAARAAGGRADLRRGGGNALQAARRDPRAGRAACPARAPPGMPRVRHARAQAARTARGAEAPRRRRAPAVAGGIPRWRSRIDGRGDRRRLRHRGQGGRDRGGRRARGRSRPSGGRGCRRT